MFCIQRVGIFFYIFLFIFFAEHQNRGKHGFFVSLFSLFGWVLYIAIVTWRAFG